MENNDNHLFITDDGFHSLNSSKFNVSYHSIQGAMQETQKVFIEMGLQYKIDKGFTTLNIFEMGFGTGLNALATYKAIKEKNVLVNYTAIEAYPISISEKEELNFVTLLGSDLQKPFDEMHLALNEKPLELGKMKFKKIIAKIEDIELTSNFDLIYYDAFAPVTQPHLWEFPIMQKMFDALVPGGILCTYCAKGDFKRTLKACGFTIESLQGPGRKREITRATKPS
jgi:tRNA U34 5-methylaminomethyl-2-thiouridine-forming methyltransferase MnmC